MNLVKAVYNLKPDQVLELKSVMLSASLRNELGNDPAHIFRSARSGHLPCSRLYKLYNHLANIDSRAMDRLSKVLSEELTHS